MKKTRVLFVVGGLHRAGAERFAYEFDRALDKSKFDLYILCLQTKDRNTYGWTERYYEKKHLELGTPITYIDRFVNPRYANRFSLINRLRQRITRHEAPYLKEKELYRYMEEFDVIHWMGEYTYIHAVADRIREKSLIQPMSSKFQNRKIYDGFDYEKFYNFCSLFNEDELDYEFSQFKNYRSIIIPLILNVDNVRNLWQFNDMLPKKIGIFTRLNVYKPLDPFFYSYQLLLDKFPDCELHVFGNGDPEREGMIDILERLGLQNHVYFRGHQEDIVQTAIEEKLALSWFQGYNNDKPSGYAGLDICTSGTPLICWDFHPEPKDVKNLVYPHYKNLNEFVNKSIELLTDREKAEDLSDLQFTETTKNRNVKVFMPILEEEYIRIADLNR